MCTFIPLKDSGRSSFCRNSSHPWTSSTIILSNTFAKFWAFLSRVTRMGHKQKAPDVLEECYKCSHM